MSQAFDPYHKWLGIPPSQQPPNHYRLLGTELFEADLDVIATAADQRMMLVRSFQAGPHQEVTQKLLNELSTARVCLLNSRQKERYDSQLRAQLAAEVANPEVRLPPPLPPVTHRRAVPQAVPVPQPVEDPGSGRADGNNPGGPKRVVVRPAGQPRWRGEPAGVRPDPVAQPITAVPDVPAQESAHEGHPAGRSLPSRRVAARRRQTRQQYLVIGGLLLVGVAVLVPLLVHHARRQGSPPPVVPEVVAPSPPADRLPPVPPPVPDPVLVLERIPPQVARVGETLEVPVQSVDPDVWRGKLTFELGGGAETGAAVDPASGRFQWTPTAEHVGRLYRFSVVARAGKQQRAVTLRVRVRAANAPPRWAPLEAPALRVGDTLTMQLYASDDEPSQGLRFSLVSGPPNARLDPDTGELRWTAEKEDAGRTRIFVVRVADARGGTADQTFSVSVDQELPAEATDGDEMPIDPDDSEPEDLRLEEPAADVPLDETPAADSAEARGDEPVPAPGDPELDLPLLG